MASAIDKTVRVNHLFDVYGQLLTSNQRNVLFMYYSLDFTLSEIADRLSVTRQAVYDSLVRAVEGLEELEASLGVVAHRDNLRSEVEEGLHLTRKTQERLEALTGSHGACESVPDIAGLASDLAGVASHLHRALDSLNTAGGYEDGI